MGFFYGNDAKILFSNYFITLFFQCIQSVEFRILIKCHPGFSPQRGIRKSDPLSLFLFLICAEGFLGLIWLQMQNRTWQGISIGRRALVLAHFLFADDNLLFLQASEEGVAMLKRTLHSYEELSSQAVTLQKSTITFTGGVSSNIQSQLSSLLNIQIADTNNDKYLGLLYVIGRSKQHVFHFLRDQSSKKSIQGISVYTTSVFLLPETVINKLWCRYETFGGVQERICTREWCGKAGTIYAVLKNKEVWVFGIYIAFKLALFAKQAWTVLTEPKSLLPQLLKAKYFLHRGLWRYQPGRRFPMFAATYCKAFASKTMPSVASGWWFIN